MRKVSPPVVGPSVLSPRFCDHVLNKQFSRNIGFHHRHRGRYSDMQFCVIIFFEDRACVPRQILLDRDCFLNRLSAISEMQATSIRAALKNTGER